MGEQRSASGTTDPVDGPRPDGDALSGAPAAGAEVTARRGRWSVGAVLGAATGLAPHLLHHVGLLAGTALLAGAGGTVVFGGLGLVAMLPVLVRLRRRFSSRWAPGIAMALFAAMFAVSTFLIGPALRTDAGPHEPGPVPSAPSTGEHTRHHD